MLDAIATEERFDRAFFEYLRNLEMPRAPGGIRRPAAGLGPVGQGPLATGVVGRRGGPWLRTPDPGFGGSGASTVRPVVEGGRTPDASWCGRSRSVSYDEVYELRDACRISLGPCDLFGPGFVLEAEVPAHYQPSSSLEDTLRDFAPTWYDRTYGVRGRLGAMGRMVLGGGRGTTLHWRGLNFQDPWRDSLKLALATIRGFADVVDAIPSQVRSSCGYSAASVVARFAALDFQLILLDCTPMSCLFSLLGMEPLTASIAVDADGLVTATRESEGVIGAFTWDPRWFAGLPSTLGRSLVAGLLGPLLPVLDALNRPTIFVPPTFCPQASLADYYLWWARKLHSRVVEGEGSWTDALVGMCCARAAIAEIADIAELLFHEMGHLSPGGPFHCSTPFLLTAFEPGDPAQEECCQYVGQVMFYHLVAAELGLPKALLEFGGAGSPAVQGTRFQTQADRDGEGTSRSAPVGAVRNDSVWESSADPSADDCSATHLVARHCSLFAAPHRLEISWTVPASCSWYATHSGTVVWRPEASDDCGAPGDQLWST